MNSSSKVIETVNGSIDIDKLGITLTHEHLFHKATISSFTPRQPFIKYRYLSQAPFDVENLWWINHHPYSHIDNLRFDDLITADAIENELKFYKDNGGSTIVEVTTFGKNLSYFKELSLKTGVNIIAGAGFYVHASQSSSIHSESIEKLASIIRDELLIGDNNGIKCGVIGEIGTTYPMTIFERKVIQASAILQSELNVPVTIHPGRNETAPFDLIRLFLEAGGKAEKTVMCHLDRTLTNHDKLLDFAKSNFYCEFDLFGVENSYYELSDTIDMLSDAQRLDQLKCLIDNGHKDQILISHDIHTKHRLMKFGGHGFSHILLNTVPKMKLRGFNENDIQDILIKNPQKWLTL